jgi:hypothetical protein
MSAPPLPPLPTGYHPHPLPPPVPPLPPEYIAQQRDQSKSPLPAPRPHRLDPDLPSNVRDLIHTLRSHPTDVFRSFYYIQISMPSFRWPVHWTRLLLLTLHT